MTTDVVEKCVRAARRIEHRGCCTGAALEDTVNMPISVRERECILAVIDALADGVSDEMMEAAAKTLLVDPSRLSPGGVDELRRALAAAIRAAKSREG